MNLNIEKEVKKIIASSIKTTEPIDTYDVNGSLQNIGMDSITFVQIIVALENAFDIEFPDNKLSITEAGTIASIVDIIKSVLESGK